MSICLKLFLEPSTIEHGYWPTYYVIVTHFQKEVFVVLF